jgi:hypothetical protein
VRETTHNSQLNLVSYIQNNPSLFASDNYDNLTVTIQSALSRVASNKQWFVQVFQAGTPSYNVVHASRCLDCFTIFDVNQDYNVFVAGVDSNAAANPSVQFHNYIDFERSKDYASDLQQFVNDITETYCLVGVTAVLPGVKQSLQFPDQWPSFGYVYVQDRVKFLVWAVKDVCIGWN